MDIAQLGILVDSRNVRGAAGDLRSFTRESDRAEGAAKRLGRTAVASLGAFASFATLQQAARHTLGFKAAMAEVSTLLDTQPGQMDALARSARNLAKEYGTNATSQARAYYQAISAGATGAAEATRILDTANRLAIGGVTDVTTGVDILTTAMNAYRSEGLTAAEASDALFVGMKAGKTTIADLSGSLGSVIPLARAMGVSFDEVVAGTAALTTQGIQTSEAVTGLRAALTAVTNPSKQAADLAEALGLKFDSQALAAKGLEGFLADVIEKTGGSSDAMATLFSSTEATTAALALAGGGSEKFSAILEDMRVKAGATATAFEKMAGDDLHRLNVVMSTVTDRTISLGGVVLSIGIPALEMLVNNMNTIVGVGSVLAGVFAARLAVSVGTTFVVAAVSAVKQSIALELALGATSKSAAMASVATKGFSRALTFLKGAIIATGIGALVIGAGFLVGKFLDLVTATGGWGNALELLGDVAKAVWDGIKSSAKSIKPSLNAIWAGVKSGFFEMISHISELWASFLGNLGADLEGIPVLDKFSEQLIKKSGETIGMVAEFDGKAKAAAASADKLNKEAGALAAEGFNAAKTAAKKLLDAVNASNGSLADGEETADALATALGNLPPAATTAANGLKDAADAAKGFNETLEDAAYTAEEFGAKKADIMIGGIDGIANAWGDFVASGFRDFSSFKDAVFNSFKSLIAQMIALAARNRIMISLGLGGVTGSAASLGSGIVGQNGLLGGLFGGGSGGGGALSGLLGVGGSFLSGASGFATSLFGAGGGFGAAGTYLSGVLGTATTSAGAFAAAAGAIAAPLLAVAAVFSFFKKKTKLLDAGLRVTVEGFDAAIETFKKTETSRFWGLSKKRRTTYTAADAEVADPIAEAVSQVQTSVLDMAKVFGIGEGAFADFTAQIKISTKGLTDEQIAEEFQKQLGVISDGMSDLVLAGTDFAQTGESSTDTLTRLTGHLVGANGQLDLLGLNLFDVSLAGADAASQFVQLFNSLDEFSQLTASYYANFYSDAERLANAQASLEETMQSLGFSSIPETHAQFRMLVDAMSEMGDQEGLATLLKVAPAFNDIANATNSMMEAARTNALTAVQEAEQVARDAYTNALRAIEAERKAIVDSLNVQMEAARAASDQSRSLVELLDRALQGRTGNVSENMRRSQALALVKSGDTSNRTALETALTTLGKPSEALFGSYIEYARDFASTSAAIAHLRDNTADALSIEEQIVANLEQQLEAADNHAAEQIEALNHSVSAILKLDDSVLSVTTAIDALDASILDLTSAQVALDAADKQFAAAQLREAQIQNNLTAELLAISQENERQKKVEALQGKLEAAMAEVGSEPLLLKIIQEVARGGSLFKDHASYVRLNDGQTFSSKTGGSATELEHARRQAQSVISASQSAHAAWLLAQAETIDPLRQQIIDLGGVPQFAKGGSHAGGWRVVGERGWELEHTGPSRVVSNSDARNMLDNREVVRAIQSLEKRLDEMDRNNEQGQAQIAKFTKKSADIAQHNKTKAELEAAE